MVHFKTKSLKTIDDLLNRLKPQEIYQTLKNHSEIAYFRAYLGEETRDRGQKVV